MERRYDIDWIRVIAIGLLLLYHIGIVFQPWGVFLGFLQSQEPLEGIWPVMALLNVWRIPLLFFVSGMGVCFAMGKRNWKQLIVERTRRIFVPFLFGMIALVPLHVLIWQHYYSQDLRYAPGPGHLWFLGNIFAYVLILSPLFFLIKKHREGKWVQGVTRLFSTPFGLLIITAAFVLETLVARPEPFALFALTLHGFALGIIAFLSGFLAVISGPAFWKTVTGWRWLFLGLALSLYVIRLALFDLDAPGFLPAAESTFWIFATFGFGARYLNRPGKALHYLSQGAYPIYIIHMVFLYLGAALILPMQLPTLLQFILLSLFTIGGCLVVYELIIRRAKRLRPLFGLNPSGVRNGYPRKKKFLPAAPVILSCLLLLPLLSAGCEIFDDDPQYAYQPPEQINDGLEAGSLFDLDVAVEPIEKAVSEIRNGHFSEVHAMLIFKDGKLVLEEYFAGHDWKWDAPGHHGEWVEWDRTRLHNCHSATKSITSACIGIAIEEGFIEGPDQPIFEYLPEHQHLRNGGRERITIEHLLTMTSGLQWREWSAPYSSAENPAVGIWFQEKDPASFILEKPLVSEPGTAFNYSSGNMILLGEIIRYATGMNIDEFSAAYLFEPLGIDTSSWPEEYPNGALNNTLYLSPRAMLKFGATYLNNGTWEGNRIISKDWVDRSAVDYPGNHDINVPGEDSGKMGYSYSWWTKEYSEGGKKIHMYTASGFGGQHIMVLPELNGVVVFTGGNYLTRRPPFKIMRKYVIPALVN